MVKGGFKKSVYSSRILIESFVLSSIYKINNYIK